ncbi:threonine dehydratase [Rhodobium orientis]|uniref:Hydroxyectoine utilization dehydratase EutB n=1 Tax=Rhodobium orientis TaxID=34017 RepID=A0A327JGM7_9HYPH|nr:hydroxyectoine utilization dehydratase EutB [Rhodobium orientis]MBB4305434.1 threonine dehydratase [Rhodobium orientis]MBK5948343.1 hydroxyectoine utilization dehydratase EutB [Rhodobium orientis]RAI25489.1 hydroxyectoine utilization dehydratase EutB [Rhodobium orientis]
MSVCLADILAARKRISGTVIRTPLVPSPHLSGLAGHDFLLKLENTQPIGAFKLRGAVNAIFGLSDDVAGVTCCSTGNHGRGVAYAARARGIRAVICMSSLVPQTKVDGIRALGAEVRIVGRSQDEALEESLRLCREEGLTEISPFDDPLVIAGQGTIGLELMEDRPDLDMVLVPLSGGGLAGGIALAVKTANPKARVIGVSMDRGAAMHASIKAGHPVEVEEVASLADSLGGGIGLENKLSFALCRDLLDDVVLVTEEEIYRAMQTLYYEDRLVAEGACVVGIAALQAGKLPKAEGPVATVITGRNVDMQVFTRVVLGADVTLGDLTIEGMPYGA